MKRELQKYTTIDTINVIYHFGGLFLNEHYSLYSLLLAIGILLFSILYFAIKRYRANRIYRIGKNGERQVQKTLEKITKKAGGKLINDLYLPLYDNTTQIDHILIGPFGMVVIESKNIAGEIYGNRDEKYWTHIIKHEKKKLYNPLEQNRAHIDCIRYWLQKEHVYNVPIESLVIFAGGRCDLHIPRHLPVITLAQAKNYFKQRQFQKNSGVDVDRVYHALMAHQVTDRKKIKAHNDFVQSVSKKK